MVNSGAPSPDALYSLYKSQYSSTSHSECIESKRREARGQLSREKLSFMHRKHLQVSVVHLAIQPITYRPHLMLRLSGDWSTVESAQELLSGMENTPVG